MIRRQLLELAAELEAELEEDGAGSDVVVGGTDEDVVVTGGTEIGVLDVRLPMGSVFWAEEEADAPADADALGGPELGPDAGDSVWRMPASTPTPVPDDAVAAWFGAPVCPALVAASAALKPPASTGESLRTCSMGARACASMNAGAARPEPAGDEALPGIHSAA